MTREIRLYGLSEEILRERLAHLLEKPTVAVTLLYKEGQGTITLTGEEDALDAATAYVAECLGAYVYSYEGESLAACVVNRLAALDMTVATAESCTGGLIAAALTDVPGASRVFGTGVVSYSNRCKEHLLTVSGDTITAMGAVSAETAGQMARGVRHTGDASVGVSVTGEAGPNPAEDLPVGTVFVALADKKRTWVEELHLDGADRATIRRQAADSVLWLLWRYLSAYPMVMAGGENNHIAQKRTIPHTKGSGQPRFLSLLLPWKGDSRRRLAIKCTAWLLALAMLVGVLIGGYQYFVQPHRNQELQESLGDLYWEGPTDLTGDQDQSDDYPVGMLPVFRGLYDMNPDVGGWLRIPDTDVDYPVMNYADGYYDNHSFLKEYSLYGQPYFGSPSTRLACLVYGQNTGDGQMFSELLNYRRVAYLQEHSVIECNTIYANKMWQIFAVVVLDDRNPDEFALPTEEFEKDEDYFEYMDRVQERSLFLSDVTFTQQENLLVLSTDAQQEYGFSGARLAVFARLITEDAPALTYRVNYLAKMPSAMYNEKPVATRTTTEATNDSATGTEVESTTLSTESGTGVGGTTLATESDSTDTATRPSGMETEPTTEPTGAPSATDTEPTTVGTDSTESTTAITGSTGGTTETTKTTSSQSTAESTTATTASSSKTATTTKTNEKNTTDTTGKTTGTTTGSKASAESTKTTATSASKTASPTSPTDTTPSTAVTTATGTAASATDPTDATMGADSSAGMTDSTSATTPTGLSTDGTTATTVWPTNPTAPTEVPGDDLMGEETHANIGY